MNILYIEDTRRPERNLEYKNIIHKLGYDGVVTFCDNIEVDNLATLSVDGVICHSGMAGYNIVNFFAKKNGWHLLSYSGSVDSTPYLKESSFNRKHFSVDSDYFETVLPEFIERCKLNKDSN